MAHHSSGAPSGSSGPRPVESVKMDEAFLDLPDAENEPILDLRKTYLITIAAGLAFAAASFFVLLT